MGRRPTVPSGGKCKNQTSTQSTRWVHGAPIHACVSNNRLCKLIVIYLMHTSEIKLIWKNTRCRRGWWTKWCWFCRYHIYMWFRVHFALKLSLLKEFSSHFVVQIVTQEKLTITANLIPIASLLTPLICSQPVLYLVSYLMDAEFQLIGFETHNMYLLLPACTTGFMLIFRCQGSRLVLNIL